MIGEPYTEGRQLPHITLRHNDLPEILKWQVGDEYFVLAKVKMTGIEHRDDLDIVDDMPKMEARFKIKSIRAVDSDPIDLASVEKQEFNKLIVKVKSGKV